MGRVRERAQGGSDRTLWDSQVVQWVKGKTRGTGVRVGVSQIDDNEEERFTTKETAEMRQRMLLGLGGDFSRRKFQGVLGTERRGQRVVSMTSRRLHWG